MENNHAAAPRPVGMCEKLFNALHLNPALRSLHRIGYRPQEPAAMAATRPPPPPPPPSSLTHPPAKLSTLGTGVAPAPLPSGGASEKRAPERRPSRKEPEDTSTAMRAPSSKREPQAAVAPPKTLARVEGAPPPPPPSRSLTEKASSAQAKAPAPAPAAPPPVKVASKVEDGKASSAQAKAPVPAAAAAAAPANMVSKVEDTKVNAGAAGEMPAAEAERTRIKKSLTGRLMTWSTGRGSG